MNNYSETPTPKPFIRRGRNSIPLLLLFAVFAAGCGTDSGRELATPSTQPPSTTVAPVDDTTSTTKTVDPSTTASDDIVAETTDTKPTIPYTDSPGDSPTTQPPETDTPADTTTTNFDDVDSVLTTTQPTQTGTNTAGTTTTVPATTTKPVAEPTVSQEPHPDNTPYRIGDNGERIWEGSPAWCTENKVGRSGICLFEGKYYCDPPHPDNPKWRVWGKILCENQEYFEEAFGLCSDVPADATQTATENVRQAVTVVLSSGFWRVDLCLRDGELGRDDPVWDKWELSLKPGDSFDLHSPDDEHYFRWDWNWKDWSEDKQFFDDPQVQAEHCPTKPGYSGDPTNFPYVFCGFGGDEDRQRIIYLTDEFPDNIYYSFHVEADCNPVAGLYVPICGRFRVSFTPVGSQTG